jgi:hypothetical protein
MSKQGRPAMKEKDKKKRIDFFMPPEMVKSYEQALEKSGKKKGEFISGAIADKIEADA